MGWRMGRLLLIVLLLVCPHTVSAVSTRMAIAKFDVVPDQVIVSPFNVGVLAFHMGGIARVDFSTTDGVVVVNNSVTTATLNPSTGVVEYWFQLDPVDFADGPITITATAVPDSPYAEETRVLTLNLFADSGGTWANDEVVYVSISGNDTTGDGTAELPYATLYKAVTQFRGDTSGTIKMFSGTHYINAFYDNNFTPTTIPSWISIEPVDGVSREDVILASSEWATIRTYTNRIKFNGVTIDNANIYQFYTGPGELWFDNCDWFSSDGHGIYPYTEHNATWLPPVRSAWFITNSIVRDKVNGVLYSAIARNVQMRKITADVLQESQLVVNCTIDDIPNIFAHHLDIYQDLFGGVEDNIILYDIVVTNANDSQNFFLEPNEINTELDPLSNMIIKDVSIRNTENIYSGPNSGGPPYSQLMGQFVHVIFDNLYMPWQQLLLRTDVSTGNQAFSASDLIIKNSTIHYTSYDVLAGLSLGGFNFIDNIRAPEIWSGIRSYRFAGSSGVYGPAN